MGLTQSRWPVFVALLAGIAAVAALGYAMLTNNPDSEAVPASGGRYVEGVTRPPERINPLYAWANPTDRDLTALIFSGLVRLAADGTPEPDLAERWEVVGNGAGYVFHLREGVAWQDDPARPVTAADVKFTFDAITAPGFRGDPALAQLMDGVSVTVRDAYTIEFRLEQAYAPFLAYLTLGILPQHLLADFDADGLFNADFNLRPIGTGPYRLQRVTAGGAVLESNPTYHFGPPHISTLELRAFPDDGSLVEALRDGNIDGALLGAPAATANASFLRENDALNVYDLTETPARLVYFNTHSELFADERVRQALASSTDAQGIIDGASAGTAVRAVAGIPPGSWAYGDTEPAEFDPGAAARSLESAGWTRGTDGVRANTGLRLSFALSTPNDALSVNLAEQVARQWRAVGAEVEVLPRDGQTYVEETLLARDFVAALAEVDYGPDPDPYPFWHSTQVQPPGRNVSGYQDDAMDNDLERARQTTDIDRRRELYASFAELFMEGAPAVPLYHATSSYVHAAAVQGYESSLLISRASRFHNVHEWYLHTRAVD